MCETYETYFIIYYLGDRNTLNQDQLCSLWIIFSIPLIIRWASLGNPGEVNVWFLARDLVNNHWSPPSPPTCSCCCAWFVADCCCREGWSRWGDKEEFWVAFIVPEIEEIISVYWPCNGRSLITQCEPPFSTRRKVRVGALHSDQSNNSTEGTFIFFTRQGWKTKKLCAVVILLGPKVF